MLSHEGVRDRQSGQTALCSQHALAGSIIARGSLVLGDCSGGLEKPLIAGIDMMACVRRASSLLKHGSPRLDGHPRIIQVTVPPIKSRWSRSSAIMSSIRFIIVASGHRTGRNLSTLSRVRVSTSSRNLGLLLRELMSSKSLILPTEDTKATISTP